MPCSDDSLGLRRHVGRPCIALVLLIIAGAVHASICADLAQNYIVQCRDGTCADSFVIAQVPAGNDCRRRSKVMRVESRLSDVLQSILREVQGPRATGIYEVHLSIDFSCGSDSAARAGSLSFFRAGLEGSCQANLDPPLAQTPATTTPTEMVARLRAISELSRVDADWMVVRGTDPSVEAMERARQGALKLQSVELLKHGAELFAVWAGLVVLLDILVHTVHLFYRRLYEPTAIRRPWRLLVPILVQIAALALSTVVLAMDLILEFWPALLMFPAVVVLLIAEGWSAWRNWRVRRLVPRRAST